MSDKGSTPTPSIQKRGNLNKVCGPENLKPTGGISINPPPSDGCCHCCGRHTSELAELREPGDDGVLLLKRFRRCGPYDQEADRAYREAERSFEAAGYEEPQQWLEAKYGKEEGRLLCNTANAAACVMSSWECVDCLGLCENEDEYWARFYGEHSAE